MTELTPELLDLMEHEKVIEQGLGTFVEVGCALLAIKANRKYRAAGYATFEAYCRERWALTQQHALRLATAAATAEMIAVQSEPTGSLLPTRESQVRPLSVLPLEERAAAWTQAVEQANGEQPTAAVVAAIVEERRAPQPVPKPGPKFNGGRSSDAPPHPAVFSDAVLDTFRRLLDRWHARGTRRLLDPFAGTGRIHELAIDGWETVGVELEPEWAQLHPDTIVGDARTLTFARASFDAVVTSPAYGNRLADSYDASDPEARRSYAIDLGHPLTGNNGAGMQWGDDYRELHAAVWAECVRVLRPEGLLLLNCKDHQRDGQIIRVTGWHVRTLVELGLRFVDVATLPAAGLPFTTARPLSELVVVLRKPA
jgi:SAM-dependent methyltransferase